MDEKGLLERVRKILERESNLVKISGQSAVFVGDTHGDMEATIEVFDRYGDSYDHIVFLGDYVDRGPNSLENIWYLLSKKAEFPKKVHLLMGNHEGWKAAQFSPADFWMNLKPGMRKFYIETLAELPYAVHTANGIIATHGGLPDVKSLSLIENIELGSKQWRRITWGDWVENSGFVSNNFSGRPQLGRDYFFEVMKRFGKNVLIRSHQPHAKQYMFDNRCLTIFTSQAYGQLAGERRVAIANLGGEINTAKDLEVQII